MREGWGWEMQGSSSSPGDASIVAVGEGGAGGGGREGHHRRRHRLWGCGSGCGHCVIDTSGGVVVKVVVMVVVGHQCGW